jgi:hypothetical protein
LRQITLPTHLRSLGAWALSNCDLLETVDLPPQLTQISDSLFYGTSLVQLRVPEGVTAIGDSAFSYCLQLTNIVLPASLVALGPSAFANCRSLAEIQLPPQLKVIAEKTFYGCDQLARVDFGTGVTTIQGFAFRYCPSLEQVVLPDSVVKLEDSAFEICSKLRGATLGRGVREYSALSFFDCPLFQTVEVAAENPYYASQDGVLFDKAFTQLIYYPLGRTNASYEPPLSVTAIGTNAFVHCAYLRTMSCGNVAAIGYSAFSYSSLEVLTNAGALKTIGEYAFAGCDRLKSVTFSPGLESIGGSAFGACAKLPEVDLPASVTHLGNNAFAQCTALSRVTLSPGISTISERAFAGSGLSTLVIPQGVEKIGDWAFAGSSLQTVVIPGSVQSLGWLAFGDCPALKSVYFQGYRPWLTDANLYGSTTGLTQYYFANTPGWGASFAGHPTAVWPLQFLENDASLGVRHGQFGFTTCWGNGSAVVVEACTNITQPVWVPIATNVLTGGSVDFRDGQWTNAPQRFYRLKKL